MSRTSGHNGSRHTYWKGHPSHASTKYRKQQQHRVERAKNRTQYCCVRQAMKVQMWEM